MPITVQQLNSQLDVFLWIFSLQMTKNLAGVYSLGQKAKDVFAFAWDQCCDTARK